MDEICFADEIARVANDFILENYMPLSGTNSDLSSIFQTSTGTEPECMYLIGDFAVKSTSEHCLNGCVKLNRNFVLTKEKGTVSGNNLTVEFIVFSFDIWNRRCKAEFVLSKGKCF